MAYHRDQSSELPYRNSWIDYFINYVPDDKATQAQKQKQVDELKEQVRKEFFNTIEQKPTLEQLEFLDNIQRLGVGYHFEDEIEEALKRIYETHDSRDRDVEDLYHASLRFRLLRQHGFNVPCDIFNQFVDETGHFKVSLTSDVEGLLSLYEASHLRTTHGDDDILEEALTFTTAELLKLMTCSRLSHHPLAPKVTHALVQPLYKCVARLESRHYILFYEDNPCHNKILLRFAKLDFNLLQSLHKEELGHLTRWYFDLDVFSRIPYKYNVREVSAIIFFCALGTLDERPQYGIGRMIFYKLVSILTIISDFYDVCDIEDLKLLTEAIQRWDRGCVNQLPDDLKLTYTNMLDTFDEVEQHLAMEGRSHTIHYVVEIFRNIWIVYLRYSKWCCEEYDPTFEEYMNIAKPRTCLHMCTIIAFLGMGEIATPEIYEWAGKFPKAIEALSIVCRIKDDIVEYELMEGVATHKPCAVSCYMKQHKVNKEQACHNLLKMVETAWKDINQAMLRPTIMPRSVLMRALTQTRYMYVLYVGGDGFTLADKTPMKENLALLFKDHIPF